MQQWGFFRKAGLVFVVALAVPILLTHSALAAGIRLVPSVDRVVPGEDFTVEVVADGIPAEGLGAVQFRLQIEAPGSVVAGVPDLAQAGSDAVAVASPLLVSAPTATRSGLGDLFLAPYQGGSGILVLDNEALNNGSALYTFAHTNGAGLPSGSGPVARFRVRVGKNVAAEQILLSLAEVMLLDGGTSYPLDYNQNAAVTLRCTVLAPNLAGLSLGEAQAALSAAGLTLGGVHELSNPTGVRPLNVVLEQSAPAGSLLDCESTVNLAINTAPAEPSQGQASDKAGDDSGRVVLTWNSSPSVDVAGYRIYAGPTRLAEISHPQGSAEVGGLANGVSQQLRLTAYDTFGNESAGILIAVVPLDDVPPAVTITGVEDGAYYRTPLTPQIGASDTHLDGWTATLNGATYNFGPVGADGSYTLAVVARDVSGNETRRSFGFTVDATPPTIAVANLVQGGHYNIDIVPQIAVEDLHLQAVLTVYSLNGQPYVPGMPVTAEGGYRLTVAATDLAGNTASHSVDFEIDKTAPQITLEGVTDSAFYNADVIPTFGVTDVNLVESSIALNGQPFVSGTPVAAEGTYDLVLSGRDRAGNTVSRTVTFTIDKAAPQIVIDGVANGTFYNTDVIPVVAVTDLHLAESSITLNDQPFVSGTPVVAEGAYRLLLSGRDRAGNAASREVGFTIDRTAPAIAVTGVQDGAFYNSDVVPQVSVIEAHLQTSTTTMNDQPFESGTSITGEGIYSLVVAAEDLAGNRAGQTVNFHLDKTVPITSAEVGAPRFASGETLFVNPIAVVSLTAVDGGTPPAGLTGIDYAFDQLESWLTYAVPLGLADLNDGPHTLAYRASDRAGNREEIRSLPLHVDGTAPQTLIGVGQPEFAIADTRYVTGDTLFTLTANDNLSGVARTEYRVGEEPWQHSTASFNLASLPEGGLDITYRSVDQVDNLEAERLLAVTVDNTPPVTEIVVGAPNHAAGEVLFVTGATEFTLTAADHLAGVAATEYRVDDGSWAPYAPFAIPVEGAHTIEYRSADHLGNLEATRSLAVVVDSTPPATTIHVGEPHHQATDILYAAAGTVFTLQSEDGASGTQTTEYRLDGGPWQPYLPFSIAAEGGHLIEYRSSDRLGNGEAVRSLSVIVDDTPPVTRIAFNRQSFIEGDAILVTDLTEITLTADDPLSGVRSIRYRFDDEPSWRTYYGTFRLADLANGSHLLHFRSLDNVDNAEAEHTVTLVRVGVEVATTILNLPRVLVWTADPAKIAGKNRPVYTLEWIQAMVAETLDGPDIYSHLVTDKDEFLREFRSGIYNQVMILDQNVPFDAVFLRELREAVHRGTGLLVSSWGNNVHPVLQDLFGVDFKGSLAMSEAERSLLLFDSPLSPAQPLTASGRVLKTRLAGGTLAGIIPGESACSGLRALDLHYPVEVRPSDRVTVTLSTPQGKRFNLVDEEQLAADTLPAGPVNRFTGHAAGDLAVTQVTATGVSLRLAASFGYLGESYTLSVSIEGADGRRTATGPVSVNPTCGANLRPGMLLGPFAIVGIDEDRTRTSDDLPAVVLNRYGDGRTAFLAYDLLGSAYGDSRGAHLGLLRQAASHLLPEVTEPAAGSVLLLETRVRLQGTGMELLAVETLGEGLTHLPLFDLTRTPLEYRLSLEDGGEVAYRYFFRVADAPGEFGKETGISLGLTDGWAFFGRYPFGFAVESDSRALLHQALTWVEENISLYPQAADDLRILREQLILLGSFPASTPAEAEQRIDAAVQATQQALKLGMESGELRQLLDEYLRIIEGEAVFSN